MILQLLTPAPTHPLKLPHLLHHGRCCHLENKLIENVLTTWFSLNCYNQDILDRSLQEPAAALPHTTHEDVTGNQPSEPPLLGVTSSCESIATPFTVAERALCRSAELLRDLDILLSSDTATAK